MVISEKLENYIFKNLDNKIDSLILYNFYHTPKYKSYYQKNQFVIQNTGNLFELKENSKISDLLQEYALNPEYLEEINGYQNIYHKITVNILEWIFYNIYKELELKKIDIDERKIEEIKEYLHSIKYRVVEKIEEKEDKSLYTLVENNLGVLTHDFLYQSFDFLHLVFEEHTEKQTFNKLINKFMKINHSEQLVALSKKNKNLQKQLNKFVENLSIEDIKILDKYYPRKGDEPELFWINKDLLQEKIKMTEGLNSLFENLLNTTTVVNEEEEIIFKTIVPLIKSIYQIPGRKEVVISVEGIYNKFILDNYNRVVSKDAFSHISFIDCMYHALKTNGSILVTQHFNGKKILFGAVLHERDYCGLTKKQLIDACNENDMSHVKYIYKDWNICSSEDFAEMIRRQEQSD